MKSSKRKNRRKNKKELPLLCTGTPQQSEIEDIVIEILNNCGIPQEINGMPWSDLTFETMLFDKAN